MGNGEDELYRQLGNELLRQPVGGFQLGDARDAAAAARRWLALLNDELARLICDSGAVRMYLADEQAGDRMELATGISVVLSQAYGDVPLTYILSALLVLRGIAVLCGARNEM
jgi:hypothetical protein